MKPPTLVLATFLASLLPAAPLTAQSHGAHGSSAAKSASAVDAELIARARASYPLKTCLVSDEPLGSMGEPAGYVHRAPGQPARVIFVCCAGCIDDFKANPAKFLPKLDAAAPAKPVKAAKKA
jgi:hypothetical protein